MQNIRKKKLFYANIIYFVSYCFLHARPQSLFHVFTHTILRTCEIFTPSKIMMGFFVMHSFSQAFKNCKDWYDCDVSLMYITSY